MSYPVIPILIRVCFLHNCHRSFSSHQLVFVESDLFLDINGYNLYIYICIYIHVYVVYFLIYTYIYGDYRLA